MWIWNMCNENNWIVGLVKDSDGRRICISYNRQVFYEARKT